MIDRLVLYFMEAFYTIFIFDTILDKKPSGVIFNSGVTCPATLLTSLFFCSFYCFVLMYVLYVYLPCVQECE